MARRLQNPSFVFYQLIENVEAPILPHELHELLLSFESTLGARPIAPLIRRTSERMVYPAPAC
jgi:hypothetical protein